MLVILPKIFVFCEDVFLGGMYLLTFQKLKFIRLGGRDSVNETSPVTLFIVVNISHLIDYRNDLYSIQKTSFSLN